MAIPHLTVSLRVKTKVKLDRIQNRMNKIHGGEFNISETVDELIKTWESWNPETPEESVHHD